MQLEAQQRRWRARRARPGVPEQRAAAAPGARRAVDDALAGDGCACRQLQQLAQRRRVLERPLRPPLRGRRGRAARPARRSRRPASGPARTRPGRCRCAPAPRRARAPRTRPRRACSSSGAGESIQPSALPSSRCVRPCSASSSPRSTRSSSQRSNPARRRLAVVARHDEQRHRRVAGDLAHGGEHAQAGRLRRPGDVVQDDADRAPGRRCSALIARSSCVWAASALLGAAAVAARGLAPEQAQVVAGQLGQHALPVARPRRAAALRPPGAARSAANKALIASAKLRRCRRARRSRCASLARRGSAAIASRGCRRRLRRRRRSTPLDIAAVDELGQALGGTHHRRRARRERFQRPRGRRSPGRRHARRRRRWPARSPARPSAGTAARRRARLAAAAAARRRSAPARTAARAARRHRRGRRGASRRRSGRRRRAGASTASSRAAPRQAASAREGWKARVSTPSGWQATRATPQSARCAAMLRLGARTRSKPP